MSTHKHRHAVVLPVFLCLVLTQAGMIRSEVRADLTAQVATAAVSDAVRLVPEGRAVIRDGVRPLIEQGTVLVYGSRVVRAHVGIAELLTVHGGYFVSRQGTSVTVAAIVSPVLVRLPGQVLVVPAGSQLRLRGDSGIGAETLGQSLQPVPHEFLERRRLVITQALAASDSQMQSITDPSWRETSAMSFLQLPAARERVQADLQERERMDWLRSVESITPDQLGVVLQDHTLLPDESARIEVLRRTAHRPTLGSLVLQTVPEDVQWLAYVHPELQKSAWLAYQDVAAPAIPMPVLLQFPVTDTDEKPAGEAIVRVFGRAVLSLDPEDQSRVLMAMEPFVTQARAHGLSERLSWYAEALAPIDSAAVSPSAQSVLAALKDWDAPVLPPEPVDPVVQHSSVASTAVVPTSFNAVEAETALRNLLQEAGAIFTTQTTLQARAPEQIVVQGIVFARGQNHNVYTLRYDSTTQMIYDIVQDGTALPYPMPLPAFAAWARGE